jgi:hypothetical protein
MYKDKQAQQSYESAQRYRALAANSSSDVRNSWLRCASSLERAAQLNEKAHSIELRNKQLKEALKFIESTKNPYN